MLVSGVRLVSVPVSDQERAKRFYLDLLGFELRADTPFADGAYRWLEVAPEGSSTSLALVTWFDAMPPGSLQGLMLHTDDVHGAYGELVDRGLDFHGPVQTGPWGAYALFADPDGNVFLLSEPPA